MKIAQKIIEKINNAKKVVDHLYTEKNLRNNKIKRLDGRTMKWISIEKEMPKIIYDGLDRSNAVLVVTENKDIELAALYPSGWRSFTCLGTTKNNLENENITHWMHVPDSPQTKE